MKKHYLAITSINEAHTLHLKIVNAENVKGDLNKSKAPHCSPVSGIGQVLLFPRVVYWTVN